jgi:hypothetical protein
MARFKFSGDYWTVGSVRLSGNDGFTAVITRNGDDSAIWRWVCAHSDHTPSEASACGHAKLFAARSAD